MADDIVQRMMDNEADANRDIANKSFHHTVQPVVPDPTITFIDQSVLSSGQSVHEELLRRAQQKESLKAAVNNAPKLGHYRDTLVGAASQDKEIRREITIKNREDRIARKIRFGQLSDRSLSGDSRYKHRHDRQKFNTKDLSDTTNPPKAHDKQAFNTAPKDSAQPKALFREPSSRKYDPFK